MLLVAFLEHMTFISHQTFPSTFPTLSLLSNGVGSLVGVNNISTDGSSPQGFNCSQLYSQIYNNFDQVYVWGGDKLRIENGYSFSNCSCPSGCNQNFVQE